MWVALSQARIWATTLHVEFKVRYVFWFDHEATLAHISQHDFIPQYADTREQVRNFDVNCMLALNFFQFLHI